jgi:hypothetical protein
MRYFGSPRGAQCKWKARLACAAKPGRVESATTRVSISARTTGSPLTKPHSHSGHGPDVIRRSMRCQSRHTRKIGLLPCSRLSVLAEEAEAGRVDWLEGPTEQASLPQRGWVAADTVAGCNTSTSYDSPRASFSNRSAHAGQPYRFGRLPISAAVSRSTRSPPHSGHARCIGRWSRGVWPAPPAGRRAPRRSAHPRLHRGMRGVRVAPSLGWSPPGRVTARDGYRRRRGCSGIEERRK